jgi:exosome complex RNA-binding protein Rrp4
VQKAGEGFRVDIGSAHPASLDGLAFEGATKRNRPNLKVRRAQFSQKILRANFCAQIGNLIYARVSLAHKDMEPELECFDAQTRKAEGFGELKGGFMVRCSLAMCRRCVPSVLSSDFNYDNSTPLISRGNAASSTRHTSSSPFSARVSHLRRPSA